MALEGTHIRLAVDMLDRYDIQDMGAYISGTIYPDSRYVTKIERSLTHDASYLEKDFAQDDFRKGWQLHLLCDDIQLRFIRDLLNAGDQVIEQGGDLWVNVTAVKILQEISDLTTFDITAYLQYIKPSLSPNGEDVEGLKKYYGELKDLYTKKKLQPEDYGNIFRSFGIPENVSDAVFIRCVEFQKDEAKMKIIGGLYNKILEEVKSHN